MQIIATDWLAFRCFCLLTCSMLLLMLFRCVQCLVDALFTRFSDKRFLPWIRGAHQIFHSNHIQSSPMSSCVSVCACDVAFLFSTDLSSAGNTWIQEHTRVNSGERVKRWKMQSAFTRIREEGCEPLITLTWAFLLVSLLLLLLLLLLLVFCAPFFLHFLSCLFLLLS